MRSLFVVLLTVTFLAGCGESRPVHRVQLSDVAPVVTAISGAEESPIRIAAAPIISPQETVRSYGRFFAYLEERVSRPIELVQSTTYQETYDLLRQGSLDLAIVCTYVYVHGHDAIGLQLLAAPQVKGKAEYQSLIIVHADSDIQTFADLEGRQFAFTDPLSTSGRLYPLSILKGRGLEAGSFFASVTYTYSHDNSIKAVVQGLIDGAAVDSLVFDQWVQLQPELGRAVRIIDRSGSFPSPPFVASSRLDAQIREPFQASLLTMHQDAEGRAILRELGIDRFVTQSDQQYDSVRALAAQAGILP